MDTIYIIRNQHTQYLTRKKEWVDGREPQPLFKTPHHDVALNELIEINAKDIELRCELVQVETTEKGLPVVTEFGPEAPAEDADLEVQQDLEADSLNQSDETLPEQAPGDEQSNLSEPQVNIADGVIQGEQDEELMTIEVSNQPDIIDVAPVKQDSSKIEDILG